MDSHRDSRFCNVARLSAVWLAAFALCVAEDAHGQSLRARMLVAEDARVSADASIEPLLDGLRSADPALAAQAARALGRFEQPRFIPRILPLLDAASPAVRREAANALAQSLAGVTREGPERAEVGDVLRALRTRLRAEVDPATRGTIAESLGRLPFTSASSVSEAETTLRDLLPLRRDAPLTVIGAARGLAVLLRFSQALKPSVPPDPLTRERLRATAALGADSSDPALVPVRRSAWSAVLAAAAGDAATVEKGLADPDAQVRRAALVALGTLPVPDAERRRWLDRALRDPSFNVRYEAVRVFSRTLQARDCAPILAAAGDANAHVRLAAIDALATGCPAGPSPGTRLEALADTLPPPQASSGSRPVAWHDAAHALVSLAQVSRAAATRRLPRFSSYSAWQVRMYAARAAAFLGDAPHLERLAADANDNVREAAVTGLRQVSGHAADDVFIAALARPDYQLVLSAAQALEGSPNRARAVPVLLAAFLRQSAERRDTSRDSRMALLVRLRELGSAAEAATLRPCLADQDAVIAVECASIVQMWTGTRPAVTPPPRPRDTAPGALPTRLRVTMRDGGAFVIRLFGDDAPFTVARFAALARRGYYNGLTIHRAVANFVLQGGSPGANEYAGDGLFMRDELGLRSNTRGTVGTSTRGRDTGDAQLFVNLLDNPRLDRDYTVFAEVTSGMDVVDAVLEGDVIDRVEILAAPAAAR